MLEPTTPIMQHSSIFLSDPRCLVNGHIFQTPRSQFVAQALLRLYLAATLETK